MGQQIQSIPLNKFINQKKSSLAGTQTGHHLNLQVSKAPPGRLVMSKNEMQKFVYSQPYNAM
jgi:hypothetical protein